MRSERESLDDVCRRIMTNESKSFSLASLLFDFPCRTAARFLYSWCRFCDDAVDRAPNLTVARQRLDELVSFTRSAAGPQLLEGPPEFRALQVLLIRYRIPLPYALDLLEGMRMDVTSRVYETTGDLTLYCYRVASVVGLMMVHIIRASDPIALRHAVDAGMALQMTNIARDVKEDFHMGRIYIPGQWFRELGVDRPRTHQGFEPRTFTGVTARLLDEADLYYESARQGLVYLPFRAALAVAASLEIYREIGSLVRARGDRAWDQRAVVPFHRKLALLLKSSMRVTWLCLPRILKPWRAREFETLWTFEHFISKSASGSMQ